MHLSVATANLYFEPFEKALAIIAEAGFQNIELDLFWERKEWAMAQHLRGIPPGEVVRSIQRSGLKVTSIHVGGGVLDDAGSTADFVNPALDEYLECLGYAPDCLVFHTPHVEGAENAQWWEAISDGIVASLEEYRKACSYVTIENMPFFPGYSVPLASPHDLHAFAVQNRLGVTLDTTHYAQIGTDIVEAAKILGTTVRTVHISDFRAGRTHLFIGEGDLDLPAFFQALDGNDLNAVTLECSLSLAGTPDRPLSDGEMVSRMREARVRMERLVQHFGL